MHSSNSPARNNTRFKTYPNGSTIRSLCFDMVNNATALIDVIQESDYLPSWNLMLISQAYENIIQVSRYISYEKRSHLSGALTQTPDFAHMAHSYPNGHTVRSLLFTIRQKSYDIAQCVNDQDQTPPWVLMLLSQATDEISHVYSYLIYQANR